MSDPASPLLELRGCTIRFGGLTAVSGLDLAVGERELLGLIGPNGAGKTTVFNLITGVYQPAAGDIRFAGGSLAGLRPCQIAGLGIARTFQNIRLFPSMTVFDNVRVAFHLHLLSGIAHALWRGRTFRAEEQSIESQVMEMLEIFRLGRHRATAAHSLPYGDQRRLEIVRALATRPRLLLLDEPAAGMNPSEKSELMRLIRFVQERYRIAVLLVEHDMHVVRGVCQRLVVLDYGVKLAEGAPEDVLRHPKVVAAYLGERNTPRPPPGLPADS